jgi:putative SbcD/Mre11-related phosphoesterase
MKMKDYELIGKTIFFPEQGILAVGDLHLGYETMLMKQGIILPFNQLETTKKELELIIRKIKAIYTLKKIILLGDIKHHFAFEKAELFDLRNFLRFLEKFITRENIILIRGNHDTFALKDYQLKDFYINDGIAFVHGNKLYPEILDKKVRMIVIGHIHPAIIIREKAGIKREKYKAFLAGRWQGKEMIIAPSFLPLIQGTEINEEYSDKLGWAFVSKKQLQNFRVFAVGKNKIYKFGKLKEFKA